jgi:hypothetical protein
MARQRREQEPIEWNFRSFPVAFGFAAGSLITVLLAGIPGVGFVIFVAALFGTSFGIAHIITHWFRNQRLRRAREQADEEERERRALAARSARLQQEAESATVRRRRRRRTT